MASTYNTPCIRAAPDCAQPWNLRPCPWIRSFFQHDAIARTGVDAVVPMDTYTINATEAPYDVYYYQKYYGISSHRPRSHSDAPCSILYG